MAIGLFAFLLGIRTVDAPGALVLGPRPWLLASAVATVVAGRIALHLLYWWPRDPETRWLRIALSAALPLLAAAPASQLLPGMETRALFVIGGYVFCGALIALRYAGDWRAQSTHAADFTSRLKTLWKSLERWVGVALVIFACVLPFLPWTDRYILDVSIMVLTYIMLGWGLNIVVGLAGLLDFGYVAFYAVGAYSYALIATYFRRILLGGVAPGRAAGGPVGDHSGLSGAPAARRLPCHSHPRLRRDDPDRTDQLVLADQRSGRHFAHPAPHLFRP